MSKQEYQPILGGTGSLNISSTVSTSGQTSASQKKRNALAVLLFVVVVILLIITAAGSFTLFTLSEERPMYLQTGMTANPEALCNNGEPATWHFRESLSGANENKWIIRFEGGNACFDNNTCTTRWSTEEDRRFMTPAATEVIYQDPSGGVLNGDPERNPQFHDYNAIHMHYCSSDSWMGDNDLGEGTNDSPWVFKGYQIVMGLFDELEAKPEYNFANAESVLLVGYSAGGLSIVSIADATRDKVASVAPQAEISHICDSGWFMISADEACGELMDCETYNNCPLATQFELGYDFWGTSKTLDPDCLASGLTYECTAPEYSWSFLNQDTKDNLLLIESQFDQMNHDLHVGAGCNMTEEEEDDYWVYLQEALEDSLEETGIDDYLCTRCSNHDTTPKDWWYDIVLLEDDRNVADWVQGWFDGEDVKHWEDACDGKDCNPTCPVHVPPDHID